METTQQAAIPTQDQVAAKHARQSFWQVFFPIVIASLLVIGLLIFIVINSRNGGVSLEQLGGVATIMLILPALGGLLLVLVFFGALIYLTAMLTGAIPNLAEKVILAFDRAKIEIQKVADYAADPIIKIGEISAKANQVFDSLQKHFK